MLDRSERPQTNVAVRWSTEEQMAQAEMLTCFAEVFEKVGTGRASITLHVKEPVMELDVVVLNAPLQERVHSLSAAFTCDAAALLERIG